MILHRHIAQRHCTVHINEKEWSIRPILYCKIKKLTLTYKHWKKMSTKTKVFQLIATATPWWQYADSQDTRQVLLTRHQHVLIRLVTAQCTFLLFIVMLPNHNCKQDSTVSSWPNLLFQLTTSPQSLTTTCFQSNDQVFSLIPSTSSRRVVWMCTSCIFCVCLGWRA